jgi:hypothetical protein
MDISVDQGIEGKVAALADAFASVEAISDLSDDNIAGLDFFASKAFHASVLSIGVTTVSAGALTFFMCHTSPEKN